MRKLSLLFLAIVSGHIATKVNAQTYSFFYTGAPQTWVVPPGITQVGVDVRGAEGGQAGPLGALPTGLPATVPGKGGRTKATLAVTPGQTLNIFVGGRGALGTVAGAAGGWNGGGSASGHLAAFSGGGGGGASDIRIGGVTLADRVVVGAGGGGAAYNGSCPTATLAGGDGGGLSGFAVTSCVPGGYTYTFATGGDQSSGGIGGDAYVPPPLGPLYSPGAPGALGLGGSNAPTALLPDPGISGGGGGGYFGGGSGCWTGGGGGSSYADATLSLFPILIAADNSGDGQVDICITDPGVITGTYNLCEGQSQPLVESVTGGVWSTSNTAVATIGSGTGVVTGVAAGTVTITYRVSTTCATAFATRLQKIIPAPAPIVGASPLCKGASAGFTSATPAGLWSSSNTVTAAIGSLSGLVSALTPGTTTITYTELSAGCFVTLPIKVHGLVGRLNVCNGDTSMLSFFTGGGGAWSSSNTTVASVGSSGIVSAMSIGTTTISYSDPGCPSSTVVQVFPISPNAGKDSVCVAATMYLSNIIGSGVWKSSNATVAAVGSSTGLVTGNAAGTATITYVAPGGCISATTVNVIDLPPAIEGFTEVCPGKTTTLTNPLGGGVWSSRDPGIATVGAGSGTVTGIVSDTVSILYTIRPGCSAYATILVNPIPLPITGPDTLCPGITDTIYTKSTGGLWSTSTPTIATIVDTNGIITVSPVTGATYQVASITYTMPTGCPRSKNLYIRPFQKPTISYNKTAQTFYANPPSGYGYQWYDSISNKIPKATSPNLAATTSQWYIVELTDGYGCKVMSDTFWFPEYTAVKGVAGVPVKVYPNPSLGKVFIESPVSVHAVLTSLDGRVLIDRKDAKELDITALPGAVYLISLYDDEDVLIGVRKLVKE